MIRPAQPGDHPAIVEALQRFWGGVIAVGHGVVYDASTLPALMSYQDDQLTGLLTYQLSAEGLEVVTIDAVERARGVGTALLEAAVETARAASARRLWLVTTNDNLDALRFYQRRGLRITAVAPGAVDRSRLLKPSIPLTGAYGIEIHDELTLEMIVSPREAGCG
ncbi:MAG TPA: GNAT family N-acetyltransferase [Candidatus Limnocylindrales bacterium]|nr:GNAT family N-acetyltransferase [Candidatus Limnocylindrales bacterium]